MIFHHCDAPSLTKKDCSISSHELSTLERWTFRINHTRSSRVSRTSTTSTFDIWKLTKNRQRERTLSEEKQYQVSCENKFRTRKKVMMEIYISFRLEELGMGQLERTLSQLLLFSARPVGVCLCSPHDIWSFRLNSSKNRIRVYSFFFLRVIIQLPWRGLFSGAAPCFLNSSEQTMRQ